MIETRISQALVIGLILFVIVGIAITITRPTEATATRTERPANSVCVEVVQIANMRAGVAALCITETDLTRASELFWKAAGDE